MATSIQEIRQIYSQRKLREKKANPDPMKQFARWWKQAIKARITEPNAMTLATASSDGIPSARIVLLKGVSEEGFSFFTNYESYKGQQLADNPKAALVFFWKEVERQVRITGLVRKLSLQENDAYFQSRPLASQISAIISPQSQVIESREWLDERYKQIKKASDKKITPARPDNWGGYLVKPVIIEFWQGRPGRLHDRLQYTLESGSWKIERLAP